MEQQNGEIFFPFSDKVVEFKEKVLFIREDFQSLSINGTSKLGIHLQDMAEAYNCESLVNNNRIILNNPNNLYNDKKYIYVSNVLIYYEGILYVNNKYHLCIKII